MKMARTVALDIAYEESGPSDGWPRAIHLVTNIAITLDGKEAEVRSDWTVVQNSPDGSGGAYLDQMVKQDGRWLFRYHNIDRFIAG